jgi:uncharacterized membrane protein
VGLQGDAFTGLEYSYNTPALSDGLAVCFAYPGQSADCSYYEDVSWLSQSASSAFVGPEQSRAVDLIFDASVPQSASPGTYDITLAVASNDLDEALLALPVTMEVLTPTYGLDWSLSTATLHGDPGDTVTYMLHVANTGNTLDAFDVTVERAAWPVSAPARIGPLGVAGEAEIEIGVSIPAGAMAETQDVTTLVVSSVGDSRKAATVVLTTTANSVFDLDVSSAVDTRSGAPGQTVTFTVSITNTGNIADRYALSLSGHVWPTAAPAMLGPLGRGECARAVVEVAVPLDVMAGDSDRALLAAVSQGDPRTQRAIVLTTRAMLPQPPQHDLFLPFVTR